MYGRRSLYEKLDPATWRERLCPELCEVVDAIAAIEDNPVVELGYSNYKAPELVALLVRPPTPEAMASVEAICAAHPEHLSFMEDGIGCRTHWADIDWALPVRRDIPTRKPGWLARFRARLRPR